PGGSRVLDRGVGGNSGGGFPAVYYGFHPGRCPHDAITETRYLAILSYEWIVEGDITACSHEIVNRKQARPGPGQGVREGWHLRPARGAARQHRRGAAGWDSFPRAGQPGPIGAGRAHRPNAWSARQQPSQRTTRPRKAWVTTVSSVTQTTGYCQSFRPVPESGEMVLTWSYGVGLSTNMRKRRGSALLGNLNH